MKVGDKWEVYIPFEQAYGKISQPGIPGGSTLIFEIELIAIGLPSGYQESMSGGSDRAINADISTMQVTTPNTSAVECIILPYPTNGDTIAPNT